MELEVYILPLVTLAFVGLMVFIFAHQRKKEQQRAEAIAQKGWSYVKTRRGFEISPPAGAPRQWRMEVKRSKSSNNNNTSSSNSSTKWSTPMPSANVICVGPKIPEAVMKIDLGGSMAQFVLRALLGDDASQLNGLVPVEVGSYAFQEKFSVMAKTQADADTLITANLQHAMVNSTLKSFVLLRWEDRLDVRINTGLYKIEEILELVEFAENAARELSS